MIQDAPDKENERVSPREAADHIGVSEKTLAQWRAQEKGPPYIKRGRISYFRHDLDAWLLAGWTDPASA